MVKLAWSNSLMVKLAQMIRDDVSFTSMMISDGEMMTMLLLITALMPTYSLVSLFLFPLQLLQLMIAMTIVPDCGCLGVPYHTCPIASI